MLEWKKERKAEAILKSAAEKMNKPEEDAEAIKNTILEKFGGLYDPLEEAMDEGPEALVKAGLTEGMGPGHCRSLQDEDPTREVQGSRNRRRHLPQTWRVRDYSTDIAGRKEDPPAERERN